MRSSPDEAETASLLSSRTEKFSSFPASLSEHLKSYSTARCLVYQTLVVYWPHTALHKLFLPATVSRIGSASAVRPIGCEPTLWRNRIARNIVIRPSVKNSGLRQKQTSPPLNRD